MTTRDYYLSIAIRDAFSELDMPAPIKRRTAQAIARADRIRYSTIGDLTNLAQFVQRFERILSFDDIGVTFTN